MITSRAGIRTPFRVVAVAALLLTLLTGCDLINSHACSAVGASPGVNFEVPAAVVPDAAASYRLHACANDSCRDFVGHGGGPTFADVPLPSGNWPGTVAARLTITHIDSLTKVDDVVFDATTPVEVTLYEPNGPGCDPHVFYGAARATIDGRLEAITRDS